MENYPAALERIAKSDFCLGKNNHGWRADFDWLLQPDTIVKILEGRYDNRAAPALIPPHIRQAAIEKLIASHPANPNSTRYTFDAKPEQKAELIRLKSEHEALNRKIALNIS